MLVYRGTSSYFFPWPVKDPLCPYGQKDCKTCSGFCARHYLKVEEFYKLFKNGEMLPKEPPSTIIKNKFTNNPSCVNNDDNIEILSESTPISLHESKLHLKHCEVVARNRKLRAAKAAKTRALKRLASSTKKVTAGKPKKSRCVTHAKTMDGKFHGRDIQKRKGRQKTQTVEGGSHKIQQHRKSTDKEKNVNPYSSTTDKVPTSPDDSGKSEGNANEESPTGLLQSKPKECEPVISYEIKGKIHQWSFCRDESEPLGRCKQ